MHSMTPPPCPELTSQEERARPFAGDSAAALAQLSQIVQMLPAPITVQNTEGTFLLVNDAAAALLNIPAGTSPLSPDSDDQNPALNRRRAVAVSLLTSGRGEMSEEQVGAAGMMQTFLTNHRPVLIDGQTLLLSSGLDISLQKEREHDLIRRAYYDELTNLPTRRLIEQHAFNIVAADNGTHQFALAFLDIDNFKHINDYYGHAIGDALLVEFARRLSLDLRPADLLARISGDEFVLLLNPVQSEQEVSEHLEFLLQRLRAPFFIDASEVFASASIGVSLYPHHGRSFETLSQNADIAMYRIKNATKGGAVIFNENMECEAQARTRTEQALRHAILEKRFCCAFQPKVDIRTQEIRGIEALVRLRDDNGVIQAPGEFINLAVELGLIDELTHLVLAQIVQSLDLIDRNFGEGVSISINVAAKQAGNPKFMTAFAEAMEATGCPGRFVMEVTEDAFVAKTHFQDEILPMFRKLGVAISIDDFGIGYSSLSALADITADEIKIDRSFITDIHKRPRSQGILRAIESLSEALGMTVVAEGVETFEELAYLQAATKIRYAQGYYFSRPIFLEQLTPFSQAASTVRASLPSRSMIEARPSWPSSGRRR